MPRDDNLIEIAPGIRVTGDAWNKLPVTEQVGIQRDFRSAHHSRGRSSSPAPRGKRDMGHRHGNPTKQSAAAGDGLPPPITAGKACYQCGQIGHIKRFCPKIIGTNGHGSVKLGNGAKGNHKDRQAQRVDDAVRADEAMAQVQDLERKRAEVLEEWNETETRLRKRAKRWERVALELQAQAGSNETEDQGPMDVDEDPSHAHAAAVPIAAAPVVQIPIEAAPVADVPVTTAAIVQVPVVAAPVPVVAAPVPVINVVTAHTKAPAIFPFEEEELIDYDDEDPTPAHNNKGTNEGEDATGKARPTPRRRLSHESRQTAHGRPLETPAWIRTLSYSARRGSLMI